MTLLRTIALLCIATPAFAAPVDIRSDRPGPALARQIYGQFAECPGSGIYAGLWVGPDSPVPNRRGWRSGVVGTLQKLQVPVLRWDGGCVADEYHRRDGIGPRDERPVRIGSLPQQRRANGRPDAVRPAPFEAKAPGGQLVFSVPARSALVLEVTP